MESLHDDKDSNDPNSPFLVATSETLDSLHEDVQYLWSCSDIPVYEEPPSALHFLRNHVAVSRPCIIRNAILDQCRRDEPATPLHLTLDDLMERLESHEESSSLSPLCVDVTPDGHGDCLRKVDLDNDNQKVFVKPMEREISFSDFCRYLREGRVKQQIQDNSQTNSLGRVFENSPSDSNRTGEDDNDDFLEDCVLYYSRQNDCLRQELSPLWNLKKKPSIDDSFLFPRSFPWAEEAFFGRTGTDTQPDAVNLWMGDERAVSAMHKDHYENLFYVLSGEKVFGLCPPSDAPFLYEREVLAGRFQRAPSQGDPQHQWSVVLDQDDASDETSNQNGRYSKVHWIATDLFGRDSNPQSSNDEEFPLSKYAHPVTVRVRAGELLYLPSLWFHRVTQTCETIGMNYWYDMNFESPLWCYFHFLQQLRSNEPPRHG
jgi:jumonji domain-containing protein 7